MNNQPTPETDHIVPRNFKKIVHFLFVTKRSLIKARSNKNVTVASDTDAYEQYR